MIRANAELQRPGILGQPDMRSNALDMPFPMGADLIAVDQDMVDWELASKTLGAQH